jgi:hypothetical protein
MDKQKKAKISGGVPMDTNTRIIIEEVQDSVPPEPEFPPLSEEFLARIDAEEDIPFWDMDEADIPYGDNEEGDPDKITRTMIGDAYRNKISAIDHVRLSKTRLDRFEFVLGEIQNELTQKEAMAVLNADFYKNDEDVPEGVLVNRGSNDAKRKARNQELFADLYEEINVLREDIHQRRLIHNDLVSNLSIAQCEVDRINSLLQLEQLFI